MNESSFSWKVCVHVVFSDKSFDPSVHCKRATNSSTVPCNMSIAVSSETAANFLLKILNCFRVGAVHTIFEVATPPPQIVGIYVRWTWWPEPRSRRVLWKLMWRDTTIKPFCRTFKATFAVYGHAPSCWKYVVSTSPAPGMTWWLYNAQCILQYGVTSSWLCIDFQRPTTACSACSRNHQKPSTWKRASLLNNRQSKVVGWWCTDCKKFRWNSRLRGLLAAVNICTPLGFYKNIISNPFAWWCVATDLQGLRKSALHLQPTSSLCACWPMHPHKTCLVVTDTTSWFRLLYHTADRGLDLAAACRLSNFLRNCLYIIIKLLPALSVPYCTLHPVCLAANSWHSRIQCYHLSMSLPLFIPQWHAFQTVACFSQYRVCLCVCVCVKSVQNWETEVLQLSHSDTRHEYW